MKKGRRVLSPSPFSLIDRASVRTKRSLYGKASGAGSGDTVCRGDRKRLVDSRWRVALELEGDGCSAVSASSSGRRHFCAVGPGHGTVDAGTGDRGAAGLDDCGDINRVALVVTRSVG